MTTTSDRNHGRVEGEARKAGAFALLAAHREAVIRRAQRALLTVLLETGSATADDVRELVKLPNGINAKCFGATPGALARLGIIRADGYAKTCRPTAHARPVTVWTLADRTAAVDWLDANPELPGPEDDQGDGRQQGFLFPFQETTTPAAGTAGAGG